MVGAEDGRVCLSVFGSRGSFRGTDVCRLFVRENHPLTSTPSVPPMASQFARIISRRMSTSSLCSALGRLIICFRNTRLGAQKCAVQVCHASDESYHDRRWYRSVEGQGGSKVFHRRRPPRNCTHPIFHTLLWYSHIRHQETDKATIDVEAPEDGILAKIIVSTLHGAREHVSFSPEVTRRF